MPLPIRVVCLRPRRVSGVGGAAGFRNERHGFLPRRARLRPHGGGTGGDAVPHRNLHVDAFHPFEPPGNQSFFPTRHVPARNARQNLQRNAVDRPFGNERVPACRFRPQCGSPGTVGQNRTTSGRFNGLHVGHGNDGPSQPSLPPGSAAGPRPARNGGRPFSRSQNPRTVRRPGALGSLLDLRDQCVHPTKRTAFRRKRRTGVGQGRPGNLGVGLVPPFCVARGRNRARAR